jgi:hypothetical protein
MHMPRLWRGSGWHHVLKETGLQQRGELVVGDHEVIIEREVSIDAWYVAANEAEAYTRVVAKLSQNVTTLLARVQFGKIRPPARVWKIAGDVRWRLLVVVIWVLFLLLFKLLG